MAMYSFIQNITFKIPVFHLAIICLLLLSACSQVPRQEQAALTTPAQLQELRNWTIQGKLAIRSESSAYNLLAHWQQRKEDFTLRLSGPLGWKPLTITFNDGNISILRSGTISNYNSVEALQIAIPELADWGGYLVAMPDWLKGIPHHNYTLDAASQGDDKPGFIEQKGWLIEYSRYSRINGFQLPSRIRMVRGNTQAKIIVNQWLLSGTK